MLEWIISSSALIAVIIALRFILKGKISLRLQYALWTLVLVRLLLPVSIGSSSMSIMNRVEDSRVYQDVIEPEFGAPVVVIPNQSTGTGTVPFVPNTGTPPVIMPDVDSGEVDAGGMEQQERPEQPEQPEQAIPNLPEIPPVQDAPADQAESSFDWLTVLRRVWLGGSVLLGVWLLLTNLLFAIKLRKNRSLLQMAHKLPVYVCDSVDTPCLFGFFRPAVYLTSEVAADERTMRHALEHETTHYRHGDHIWAILRCVCLAVHWYNPFVWCAAILSKIDAELACDESTIRRLGESERAEYGRTLLRLTCEKRAAIMTTATTMTGSGKVIKERIALIVKKPKMALYTLVAVLAITAVAIVCTFTGAKDKKNDIKLWPEDTVISCARFEYAGDDGYKLITSEISQFDSLQHMNLIPVEGEFKGEVIYRLVLNWNEIAKNETEYIILVSESCLSVNGQLYQPDGFDFAEILSYFEGKYRYFDYELLYDEDQNTDENSGDSSNEQNDQPSDEEIRARALIKNFASLTAEDIKYIPGFMGTIYSDVAVLLNDLAEYRIEPFESEASYWSLTVYLSGSEDNINSKNDAWLSIYAYGEESLVHILYHSKLDVYTQMYFDYPALHQYLRKRYKTDDVIDTEALSHYRDLIEAKAEHTIEIRNNNFDTKFSGYEIMAFHEVANFERDGMTYTIYEWDVGYIMDKNNRNYPWIMNRMWVDSELRIRCYDSDPYLVIRSRNGREEYDFFPWDTPLYGYDEELELAYDEIAAYFFPETDTKSYTEVASGITMSENLASLPDAVISYAVDYVQTVVKDYNDLGAYSSDKLYRIVEARITNIEQIPTGAVGLTDGINLYRLSYRLLADRPENIMLAGGMTMDGDWLTEWGSTGQPYLLMHVDWSSGEDVWTRIGVTNTDVIMTDYGTPEMLERYGSPYLAASIELYHQYLQDNGGNTESEIDITLPVTLPVLELSREEYDAACTAIMIDLKTGWWKGWAPLADCTYEAAAFECVWRETYEYTERLYGYAGYFRFDENGNCVEYFCAPTIVTLDPNTQQMYNVWWPGDGAYHEMDIISRFPDEIAEFVAEPDEERAQIIRSRLVELAAARMIPETPMDRLERLVLLTAEDIKYISTSLKTPSAEQIVDTLGASLVNRVGHDDSIRVFWTLEFYLSGGDGGGYSSEMDEWVLLCAGPEENIVEIWHHERYRTALQFFVKDEALYQLVRGSYATDDVIDEAAFSRYGDFLNARAQETVDDSRETANEFSLLPYTGYQILQFEKIDSFERDGARYEVYEWDVAFLHDDPARAELAGGMWLDSELRVRDRESDIYFVVRISGDMVEHAFFHWELYSNAEFEEYLENARATIADHFKNGN